METPSADTGLLESKVTTTISLEPDQLDDIKVAIIKHLNKHSSSLNSWDAQLGGVPLSYRNVKLLNGGKGRINEDYSQIHYHVQYNVTYFKPQAGETLSGQVVSIGYQHINLLVYDYFNAIIPIEKINQDKYELKLVEEDQDDDEDVCRYKIVHKGEGGDATIDIGSEIPFEVNSTMPHPELAQIIYGSLK